MHPTRLATVLCLLPAALAAQQDESFEAHLQRGKQRALAKDWGEALRELDQALALRPDEVEALRWRGHAYTGARRYSEALTDLERAAEQSPRHPWTQYARAMALHHLGRYADAIHAFERVAEGSRFFGPALVRTGQCGFRRYLAAKSEAAKRAVRNAEKGEVAQERRHALLDRAPLPEQPVLEKAPAAPRDGDQQRREPERRDELRGQRRPVAAAREPEQHGCGAKREPQRAAEPLQRRGVGEEQPQVVARLGAFVAGDRTASQLAAPVMQASPG